MHFFNVIHRFALIELKFNIYYLNVNQRPTWTEYDTSKTINNKIISNRFVVSDLLRNAFRFELCADFEQKSISIIIYILLVSSKIWPTNYNYRLSGTDWWPYSFVTHFVWEILWTYFGIALNTPNGLYVCLYKSKVIPKNKCSSNTFCSMCNFQMHDIDKSALLKQYL